MFTLLTKTVRAASYEYANLSMFDAVTVYTPEGGYETVTAPVGVYFPVRGGLTVRHPSDKSKSIKSRSIDAYVVSVIRRGRTYEVSGTGLSEDVWEVIARLTNALMG